MLCFPHAGRLRCWRCVSPYFGDTASLPCEMVASQGCTQGCEHHQACTNRGSLPFIWHAELSVLQVEHWKEQAGLSPAQRQFVDLSDIQDARNLPEHEDH